MKRELLHAYLVEGKSARDIAYEKEVTASRVRAAFAKIGIHIPPDKIRGDVCEAIAWAGHGSFAGWNQEHGLRTLSEQATELGVSKSGLQRHYDLLRGLVEQEDGT